MNSVCLAAKLHLRSSILDFFLSAIQVAQAPRRQPHSGLLLRLEETQGSHPEGQEKPDAPPAV